jgi:formylglycine-generating enzyme required for sulfatase activity
MNLKKRSIAILTLAAILAIPTAAAAQSSVGSYSKCDSELRGKKAEIEKCKKCLQSGEFYNYDKGKKRWVCGMTSDMKPSRSAEIYKPPPKPKAMPASAKKYVEIPPGTFKIGMRENEPGGSADKEFFDGATVTISRPFMMKATEVTHAEWYFVMGDLPPVFDRQFEKDCGLECPVTGVKWRSVLEYLNKLSALEKLEPCYNLDDKLVVWNKGLDCTGYRLPTEAEWEYAARGGTTGATYGELDDIAWHSGNSDGKYHPVGQKKPNAYGLYDMLGNAWEWTWDVYTLEKPFKGAMVDPIGGGLKQTDDGLENRVVRGGSYSDSWVYQRAAHRFYYLSNSSFGGFRPVRSLPKRAAQ